MLKPSTKAILFDLDGTLVQSADDVLTALNLTLAEYGQKPVSYDDCVKLIGDGIEKLIRRAFGKKSNIILDDERIAAAVDRFRFHYADHLTDNTIPYPGVPETLVGLNEYTLAVISNKTHRFCVTILENLHMAGYFKYILGGDSLATRKPDPGQLSFIARRLNLTPAELLLVGDSENDILAARAFGTPVAAVTYGYRSKAALRRMKPDYLIDKFSDLLMLLS
jgi:phosphoglycolate phosphatase